MSGNQALGMEISKDLETGQSMLLKEKIPASFPALVSVCLDAALGQADPFAV